MKDIFSAKADMYAKYRPHYPGELFDFILQHVTEKNNAWDCATGNGQSAVVLAKYFRNVFATDISQKQIDHACRSENILYSLQQAEQTTFDANTFDLVTVSQALHWFATDKYYNEVKRVGKPGSIIAAWAYSLCNISPRIDTLIAEFYADTLKPYWDDERRYIDEGYRTILFPFKEFSVPDFRMELLWTTEQLEGYLNTWSALQKFIAARQFNPVHALMEKIRPLVPEGSMRVVFPLLVRLGIIENN